MPVAVIGMHRSGTSLVAHILHELGLDLGPAKWLEGANEANQDGYWENVKFRSLNDVLLAMFDGAWDDPPEFDWALPMPRVRAQAQELVDSFKEPWGWKDPRTTLTLPFWRTVVPDLKVVVCERDPDDVAASLAKRDGMAIEKAIQLWLDYSETAYCDAMEMEHMIVHYELVMADPEHEIRRLAEFVGLPYDAKALEVIRPELWHHR